MKQQLTDDLYPKMLDKHWYKNALPVSTTLTRNSEINSCATTFCTFKYKQKFAKVLNKIRYMLG